MRRRFHSPCNRCKYVFRCFLPKPNYGGPLLTTPVLLLCAVLSENGFMNYQEVNVHVCPLYSEWSCYSYKQFETNVCDNLVALDGQKCPSPGNYTFEFEFDLPGAQGETWYWIWSFKLSALFQASESSTTTCSLGVQPAQSRYQMLWSFAGVAVFASAIVVGRAGRRRRVMVMQQDQSSIDGVEFQRMRDHPERTGVLI